MSQWGQSNQQWGQQPQWGGQRPNQPQPGWGQPQPGWGQPQPGWGQPAGWNTQQQPMGQQAPGWGQPQPGGQRPRRSSAGRFLLALILVPVGIFLLFAVFGAISGNGGPTPPPNQQGSGNYKNEDYQVPAADKNPPELPQPDTYGEAKTWMTDNALYQQTVAVPVRCEALPINLTSASTAQLQTHLNELTGCLMRVWGPALEAAGFTPVRPTVTIYTSPIKTPCGTMPKMNAAYCAADQQVYYSADLPKIVPAQLQNVPYVVESVIAHEFGHAIQARTGILISDMAWQQKVSQADANDLNRRLEVQADCFAGEFVNSVSESVGLTDSDKQNISKLFYSIGDDQLTGNPNVDGNHGHAANRQAWFTAGMSNPKLTTCNTFIADANQVK